VAIQNTSIGTTTDINGRYNLQHNENLPWTLEVSFVGYKPIDGLEINEEGTQADIRLTPIQPPLI